MAKLVKPLLLLFFVLFLYGFGVAPAYAQQGDGSCPANKCPSGWGCFDYPFSTLAQYTCCEGSSEYHSDGWCQTANDPKRMIKITKNSNSICPDGKMLDPDGNCISAGETYCVEYGLTGGCEATKVFRGCTGVIAQYASGLQTVTRDCVGGTCQPAVAGDRVSVNYCDRVSSVSTDRGSDEVCECNNGEIRSGDQGTGCDAMCADAGGGDFWGGGVGPQGQQAWSAGAKPAECTDPRTGEPGVETAFGCVGASGQSIGNILFIVFFAIGSGLVLIKILVGAYKIIASQGDPQKLADGRSEIISALIGAVVIVGAVVIMNTLGITLDIAGLPSAF